MSPITIARGSPIQIFDLGFLFGILIERLDSIFGCVEAPFHSQQGVQIVGPMAVLAESRALVLGLCSRSPAASG